MNSNWLFRSPIWILKRCSKILTVLRPICLSNLRQLMPRAVSWMFLISAFLRWFFFLSSKWEISFRSKTVFRFRFGFADFNYFAGNRNFSFRASFAFVWRRNFCSNRQQLVITWKLEGGCVAQRKYSCLGLIPGSAKICYLFLLLSLWTVLRSNPSSP